MNQLSWLIYFANVSENVGNACGGIFALLVILSICIGVWALIASIEDSDNKPPKWAFKAMLATFAVTLVVSVVTPDKNTVYAIAASQVGEKMLTNPRVQASTDKAFKALDHWLDKQLADDTKAEKAADAGEGN